METKYVLLVFTLFIFSACTNISVLPIDTHHQDQVIFTEDFLFAIASGDIEGAYTIQKFGRNPSVTSSITPLTVDGNYRTPTSAIQLRASSTSALDTNGSTGAWSILLIGLNATGDEITETIIMNGTSNTALTSQTFLRLYRAYVTESGTYANQTSSSQKGTITIEDSNGLQWTEIIIANSNFGVGQTQIAIYTVPRGFTCYLLSKEINVDSTRTAIVYFFQRQNILDTTGGYSGTMRLVEQEDGVTGHIDVNPKNIVTSFPELTDLGYMAETTSGIASISADFEMVCLKDSLFK